MATRSPRRQADHSRSRTGPAAVAHELLDCAARASARALTRATDRAMAEDLRTIQRCLDSLAAEVHELSERAGHS